MDKYTPKRIPHRIDEELVCIDALKYALEVQFDCEVGDPERTKPGCDPPDFWLEINRIRTPVEITSITERQTYQSHCRRMADYIQKDAINSKSLSGTYGLIVRRYPKIPKPSGNRSSNAYLIAKQYIHETTDVTTADEIVLLNDDCGTIALKKFSDRKAQIDIMHTVAECEAETIEKIARLIDAACQSKSRKLLNNDCRPGDTIIVLYDAYGFADIDNARTAAATVNAARKFHSVFWAASFTHRANETYPTEHGRHGDFLWSTIPEWFAKHIKD